MRMGTVGVQAHTEGRARRPASSSHGINADMTAAARATRLQPLTEVSHVPAPNHKREAAALRVCDSGRPEHRKGQQFTGSRSEDLRFEHTNGYIAKAQIFPATMMLLSCREHSA